MDPRQGAQTFPGTCTSSIKAAPRRQAAAHELEHHQQYNAAGMLTRLCCFFCPALTQGALLSQTSVSASQPQCDSVSPASMSGRQHTHHELTTHHSRHQLIDRRQLLVAVSTLVPLAAASQSSPAQAAAAGSSCQLQESVTGLQWCDLTVGEGQVPIKGAFTK